MGEITPGETVVDAAVQYAQHIPVNVISRMLGLPLEDDDLMREFVHDVLEGRQPCRPRSARPAFDRLDAYLDAPHRRRTRARTATTSSRTCWTSS